MGCSYWLSDCVYACDFWCLCMHTCELLVFRYWLWCWPRASAASPCCLYWQMTDSREEAEVWSPPPHTHTHWRHTHTLAEQDVHTSAQTHTHTNACLLRTCMKSQHTQAYRCSPLPTQTLLTSPSPIPSSPIHHHQPFIISPLGVSTYLFIFSSISLLTVINWPRTLLTSTPWQPYPLLTPHIPHTLTQPLLSTSTPIHPWISGILDTATVLDICRVMVHDNHSFGWFTFFLVFSVLITIIGRHTTLTKKIPQKPLSAVLQINLNHKHKHTNTVDTHQLEDTFNLGQAN